MLQVQTALAPNLASQTKFHTTNIRSNTNMSGIPPVEKRLENLFQRNREYSATYQKPPPLSAIIERGSKAPAPGGGIAIVSCSDPRVVPAAYFQSAGGEFAVIRNAGGRTFDAVRSLAVLDGLVNIGTIIIVHHTDCGQSHIMDDQVRDNITKLHPELAAKVKDMPFGELPAGKLEQLLLADVKFLKDTPLLRDEINVVGYMLDIDTGLLTEAKPQVEGRM